MNIGFISLGCAKNRVDTEIMMGLLKRDGYKIVNSLEKAEIIIINTCGFIESAKEEAIETILDTARYKQNGGLKFLIATGCMCQRHGEELFEEMPELDAVIGISHFADLSMALRQLDEGQRIILTSPPPVEYIEGGIRILTTPPGSAYLRITEGCNNKCAYCTIPGIKGRLRSRRVDDICSEARRLVKNGVRELVLVAQDTAAYGMEQHGHPRLPDLLGALSDVDGLEWIRLMYLHPQHISDEVIRIIAGQKKVLPYLDIPVQHASDHILGLMNRGHNSSYLSNLIDKIRSQIDSVVLRTTVMVGFPGETDGDFHELLRYIDDTRFDWLGVFAYVREEGTPAASMIDQIEEGVKQERLQQVIKLQQKITRQKNITRLGRIEKVLISSQADKNLYMGRTAFQAPEVDGLTLVKSELKLVKGEFARVHLKAVRNTDMIGEAIYESAQ